MATSSSLVEKAAATIDAEKAARVAEKCAGARSISANLRDSLRQMRPWAA